MMLKHNNRLDKFVATKGSGMNVRGIDKKNSQKRIKSSTRNNVQQRRTLRPAKCFAPIDNRAFHKT